MTREDTEAFDAVMLDLMGALLALPGISVAPLVNPAEIVPSKPRYDRIPQIAPEFLGLEKFFDRLQKASTSAAQAKLFARARNNVRKMLSALPECRRPSPQAGP